MNIYILMVGGLAPWHPQAGGGQLVAYKLSEALAGAGHAVDYLHMSSETRRDLEAPPGLTHIAQPPGEGWPSTLLRALKGDHWAGYDILHVHTGSGTLAYYLGFALRRYVKRDIKLALTIHSPKVYALPRSVDEVGWMLSCRAANVILAVSEFSRRDIERCYRVNQAKIHVVYNGVDTEVFHPLTTARRGGSGAFRLVFCGRLDGPREQKGIDVLLRSMPLVVRRHDAVLDIVGTGPRLAEYQRLAGQLGVAEHVRFLGFVDPQEIPHHYQQADLFALPSRRESFGLVLAEAMACGLPVVATTIGAVPEVVEDGVTGLLVPPESAEAMAAAIVSLLDDPSGMKSMGIKGRERVEKHFAWAKVAERVARGYQQAR